VDEKAAEPKARVTEVRAVHRHGQTFGTWKDIAAKAGAKYRCTAARPAAEGRASTATTSFGTPEVGHRDGA
jgi:hypothetical protein